MPPKIRQETIFQYLEKHEVFSWFETSDPCIKLSGSTFIILGETNINSISDLTSPVYNVGIPIKFEKVAKK
jgi:hypothetical protein